MHLIVDIEKLDSIKERNRLIEGKHRDLCLNILQMAPSNFNSQNATGLLRVISLFLAEFHHLRLTKLIIMLFHHPQIILVDLD